MSNFGYFSEDGSEYIFHTPQAPRPMLNYIWNARILSGINQFGGGDGAYGGRAASYIDPEGKGRAILIRSGNRYFYIRDAETGEFWNPGWYPAKKALDAYRCIHGLGYTVIEGSNKGINARLRVFVNHDEPAEIWTVNVKNNSDRKREIKVYSFVEFSLEGYQRYSEYNGYVYCEYDKAHRMIVAHNSAQERPHDWYDGFISTDLEISGFESSKRAFLGVYGHITAPETVVNGRCSNSVAACEDMVGVLEHSLSLEAGEQVSFNVLIGSADGTAEAARITGKLFTPGKIKNDFLILKTEKTKMISNIVVDTPEKKVNHITNMWVKQQVQLCAEVGRATGKGFRDQLQDSWAVAVFNPVLAKEKIIETLKHQYRDGKCPRGWLPLDPHIYSDGPVWIAPAVNAYIKETGDFDFLNEVVPYLDEGEGSVWDHILTAIRYSSEDTGDRGLVLAHDGDWNDSLNGIGIKGKGESVWTSIALYHACRNAAEIAANLLAGKETEQEILQRAERIKKAVNENGWDGEWYLAAINDEGEKVGTFKIVADCCAGRGNKAFETLMKIMPDSEENPSDHSGCEPYVFTNMYFGPDNPRAGETAFAWVTGTAGWMFRAVTQYMMGFYPGYNSIAIKPCIPDFWEECSGISLSIGIISLQRADGGEFLP